MKSNLTVHLLLGLLLATVACKPIYFETPQPKGGADIGFPAEFHGRYSIEGDTIWVDAKGYTISETKKGTYALTDEASEMPGVNRLESPFGPGKKMTLPAETGPEWLGYWTPKDDSVVYALSRRVRTALNPDSAILRQAIKNTYLLNLRADEGFWYTLQLRKAPKGGIAVTWATEDEAEVARKYFPLKEVKNDDGEISHYLANPPAKKLIKFVQADGFAKPLMDLAPLP